MVVVAAASATMWPSEVMVTRTIRRGCRKELSPKWHDRYQTTVRANLTVEDIHVHVKERLAGYKRPKYIVVDDALPKNPSGRILKRELRQQHANLADQA